MEDRELRQYFHDIFITFLGTNLKNQSNVNPDDLIEHAEIQIKKEIQGLERLMEWYKLRDNKK
jgi:hypothetical protein